MVNGHGVGHLPQDIGGCRSVESRHISRGLLVSEGLMAARAKRASGSAWPAVDRGAPINWIDPDGSSDHLLA
jgi:hypothetical protein